MFLIQEFAQENLWFYRDVLQFEKTQFASTEEMREAARQICEKYLGTGQNDPLLYVNLYQLQEIERTLEQNPNNNMFKSAKLEIESILKTKYVYFCSQ
jgi:CRISPR/Cas system endoribonuclease Cas6 (RAMP superfamily)